MIPTIMLCPECKKEIDLVDRTYSNMTTQRVRCGQHTGDIYLCDKCEISWIDNFLDGKVHQWHG